MRRRLPLSRILTTAAVALALGTFALLMSQSAPTAAPTGFNTPVGCPQVPALDNQGAAMTITPCPTTTNGPNGLAPPNGISNFAEAQVQFEEQEGIDDGLGPVYNDKACVNCHQNPVSGGISQITELRVGHNDSFGNFVNPNITIHDGNGSPVVIPNRSLVNDRAICPQAQERVPGSETVRTFRTSLNLLGDGFVEAIDSNTLFRISQNQPGQSGGNIQGLFIQVPVLEAPGQFRGARFGWKNQHASLLSFASDAYLNEMGITNRLNPADTTNVCKTTTDPENNQDSNGIADIDRFAYFMRATNAPPIDAVLAATPDAQTGSQIFDAIGCAICHVRSITTAPPGTVINGGAFTVPDALGSKTIHPFSDFLLHNVGTGDGIVQNGGPDSQNRMRTPPLWGMRTRDRLMHDGESLTRNEAILRHAGAATFVINNYRSLSVTQKNQLITFLNSL
jgi:CxxC motif-containing protein (DUF1111 family)